MAGFKFISLFCLKEFSRYLKKEEKTQFYHLPLIFIHAIIPSMTFIWISDSVSVAAKIKTNYNKTYFVSVELKSSTLLMISVKTEILIIIGKRINSLK